LFWFTSKKRVDRSDQTLSYYTFSRKTVKWWKLFFHLFDLAVVNAHILHNKSRKEKIPLQTFHENVAEGMLASTGTEIQATGQTTGPAGRLVRTDDFFYRIAATHATPEGKNQRACHVCVDTADQYLAYYPLIRKTVKWLKQVFFYLIQCCLFNSYVTFAKNNPNSRKSFLDFTSDIAENLINTSDAISSPSSSSDES
jgi:hypothetical protein